MESIQRSPKLCECGCGRPAPISKVSHKRRGYVKGQPTRYIHGHHRTYRKATPEERFWLRVLKSPDPGGCWLWQGGRTPKGYGSFSVRGITMRAHRYSYELHNGPKPADLHIRHSCDTPACVNPAHLLLGTPLDNVRDRVDRGRSAHGTPAAKITEQDVRDIRRLYRDGVLQAALAERFGITQGAVSLIVHRKHWVHVED
jgi:hypothetical protein